MPYNNEYNRMIANENMHIVKKYLNHLEKNHMQPYLEYDSGYSGGMANRAMTDNNYDEVEMKGKGFWDDFKSGFMSVMNPAIDIAKTVGPIAMAAAGKPKKGRPAKNMSAITMAEKPKKEPKKRGGKAKKDISAIVSSVGETFMTPQEKLDKVVSQGGKKRGRPSKAKEEKPKENNKIEDIIKSIEGSAMKEIKKTGKGRTDRTVGGRKLLSKEEMPVSMMSGNGMSGGKKTNKWMEHLSKFRKANPTIKGKQAVIEAKKTYVK